MKESKQLLCVRIPQSDYVILEAIAIAKAQPGENANTSQVVRKAIRQFIAGWQATMRGDAT